MGALHCRELLLHLEGEVLPGNLVGDARTEDRAAGAHRDAEQTRLRIIGEGQLVAENAGRDVGAIRLGQRSRVRRVNDVMLLQPLGDGRLETTAGREIGERRQMQRLDDAERKRGRAENADCVRIKVLSFSVSEEIACRSLTCVRCGSIMRAACAVYCFGMPCRRTRSLRQRRRRSAEEPRGGGAE